MFNYCSKAPGQAFLQHVTDVLFAIFAVVFFLTRIVLFAKDIVYGIYTVGGEILGRTYFAFRICYVFLLLLQCLHIFWFYLIMRMVVMLFTSGITGDVRSDDEEDEPADNKDKIAHKKNT